MSDDATLDPSDWHAFRAQAHRMLDDMVDHMEGIREQPVWQPMTAAARDALASSMPQRPGDLVQAHAEFMTHVLPHAGGNVHPRFMGWVQGGGNPAGMLGEMLAGALNANLGGRSHAPIEVERQILRWMRDLFGFPDTASGLFLTGSSMANLLAVLIARHAALGSEVRSKGLTGCRAALVAYTSEDAHGCIARAMDAAGLGTDALRRIAVDGHHRIDVAALKSQLAHDLGQGLTPFLVVGTAGSVDTGAIDDLQALAALCRGQRLWFHVDGALGALGMLSPAVAPLLRGIEQADSIAFDFHKWGQVPYDAGYLLVRDSRRHLDTFAAPAQYLQRDARGMSADSPWPCDFGIDLSRGFRALKTWFTFQVHGADRLGAQIARTCTLARTLADRIAQQPRLELLAPVTLNIVCFRFRCEQPDELNARIVTELQASGLCAPSATRIRGMQAIRAAIVNHRTTEDDLDVLLRATLAVGERMSQAA